MLQFFFVRKIKQLSIYVLISVFILPALLNAGATSPTGIIGLQQVLENITKTDPSILEALRHYQGVLAERSIATSEYYPTIGTELSSGPERTKGVSTDDEEENLVATNATLFAKQNLFNGGKTLAYVDETDARIKAAAYEVLNVANRIYLNVSEAYINVVKASDLLRIAEKNALTQERIMRQVREKTKAGFNRVSELYNSESRLALARGNYISRQQDLNQALAIFHRQFGRLLKPEQFKKPEPQYQFPETLVETVDLAFKSHPALKVAHYNIETKRYSYKKASASYLPTLDLELKGQYRSDTNGEEGETTQSGAYLTLNYTFFDGGYRKGVKAKERQSISKEYQRSYIERRNVNETVRLAWNIMEAEQFKKEYLHEHVLLSLKTLNSFKEEYYVGRRTLLDLLNMENEYTEAQLSMFESQFSHLTALYRIMQATGVLLEEHDTGVRDLLNLPDEEEEEIGEYEDLDENRDQDQLSDILDQCDNSEINSSVTRFGCSQDDVSTTGYPHKESVGLTPYITPQDFEIPIKETSTTPAPDDKMEPEKEQFQEKKLILQAKPNSDLITDESREQLIGITKRLQNHPTIKILIEGYIASKKSSKENFKLSERRANVIKQFMINQGINENQITVTGRGNQNPIADNNTRSGREENRRIEISFPKTQ